MRFSRAAGSIAAVAIAFGALSALPPSAEAQELSFLSKTYEVQVEYWFFDTDHYHWTTVFESDDLAEAQFVYGLLLVAKENGQLNEVVPNSYWRYIAVDVRMVTLYDYSRFVDPQYRDGTTVGPKRATTK
jgi:hypothetical protein